MSTPDLSPAAGHPPIDPPSPELRRLEPFVGSWTSSHRSVEGPGGPPIRVELSESFRWLEGGYFLESRYEIRWGEATAPDHGVMYWYHDAARNCLATIYFNDQGTFDEVASRYTGELLDDGIVFTGPARFRVSLDDQGTVAVGDDGSITVEWWLLDDVNRWQPWRTVVYRPAGSS